MGRQTPLIPINSTLTGPRYLHEILQTIVRPYRFDVGDNFALVDDNARPHRTLSSVSLSSTMQHQPNAMISTVPYMNAIQPAWDMLKVVIAQHPNPPDTLQDLTEAAIEEWDLLPQDQLDDLIQYMPRRVEELIRVRVGHTHY